MLTERERAVLRDRIAREAIRLDVLNPLLTIEEAENETFALVDLILARYDDRDNWTSHSGYLTRYRHPVLEKIR